MTQEEKIEYNENCTKFLGWKYAPKTSIHFPKGVWVDLKGLGHCAEKGLKFHSDWNWIMEVVEAIEKLGFQFNIYHQDCSIGKDKKFIVVTHATKVKTKKEAVVHAINQFLIWYNENKSNSIQ